MEVKRSGSQPSRQGQADYFTGTVRIDPLFEAAEPAASFLAGYCELRTLTDAELEALPLFARGHALITLARLERPRAEPVDASWPEWARRLRMKLDAVAAELRAQLIAS